jgi:hypothetical protein
VTVLPPGRCFVLGALGALLLGVAASARAQDCTTIVTRTAPPGIEHAFIRTVAVKTDAPVTLPVGGAWLTSWRRRTITSVVQRQLLFEPGERVDSARVAETLRRLRDQRLYSDITLTVRRCAGGDSVDLLVTTQDAWTLRPIANIVPPSTVSLGFEDRNVLGTGRSVSLTNDQTARGHGGSVALTDPWLFGAPAVGAFRFSDIGGAHLLRASVRNHELSVFDPWRLELALGRQTFTESRTKERPLRTFYLVGHAGHLVRETPAAATLVYGGAESDQGDVLSIQRGDVGVPRNHRRDYSGAEVGVLRRSAQFDTVSWFAAGRGFLDIPSSWQADILTGVGGDRAQHAAAVRYDAWGGRMWIPRPGRLLTLDGWTSGFLGHLNANHIDRVSASGFQESSRGFWAGRLMLEQLLQLDPDLRMLSLANVGTDPTYSAVPGAMRLADRSLTSSLERSVHIRPIARASMLDGALFVAGSLRWDAPSARSDHFAVAMVGARLRFFSANGSFVSTRVDVGYPVASNGSVVRRPLLSVGLTSLLDAPRQRDGRRRHQ